MANLNEPTTSFEIRIPLDFHFLFTTGHRPHNLGLPHDENSTEIIALKSAMKEEIERHINELNVTRFISGLAIGTDIWICEMVLDLIDSGKKIELEVAIPFIEQTEKWKNKSLIKYKERHKKILADKMGKICTIINPKNYKSLSETEK